MRPLLQQLKELSKDDFESLVDQLLQGKYPGASIAKIRGDGGDEGIDSFAGTLNGHPAIWQDKHFPNGIKPAQRKQVLKSLKKALVKHQPRLWTLCIPVDLTVKERRWFEKLVDDHKSKVKIELLQASHIVADLAHHKAIREAFFPQTVQDFLALREVATRTEGHTRVERALLAGEFGDQYLESLRSTDPRLDYQLILGRYSQNNQQNHDPQLLMSVFNETQTLNVFARDIVSLKQDPLKFNFEFSPTALTKLETVRRTGKPQQFASGEISKFSASPTLRNLLPPNITDMKVEIGSKPMRSAPIPTQVIFGDDLENVKYDYLPLTIPHAGTEQVTMVIEGPDFPLRIVIDNNSVDSSKSVFALNLVLEGMEVRALHKALRAVRILQSNGALRIKNLETEIADLTINSVVASSEETPGFAEFIDDLLVVADHYKVKIRLPGDLISGEDTAMLLELKRIATGEIFELENIEMTLVKDSSLESVVIPYFKGTAQALVFEASSAQGIKFLFGTAIATGQIRLHVEKGQIKNPRKSLKAYLAAKDGDPVSLTLVCKCKAQYIRSIQPESVFSNKV